MQKLSITAMNTTQPVQEILLTSGDVLFFDGFEGFIYCQYFLCLGLNFSLLYHVFVTINYHPADLFTPDFTHAYFTVLMCSQSMWWLSVFVCVCVWEGGGMGVLF